MLNLNRHLRTCGALALSGALIASMAFGATPTIKVNCHLDQTALISAIAAAPSGAKIAFTGVCSGGFTITKSIDLAGRKGMSTISGGNGQPVVTISGDYAVTFSDVWITGGDTSGGGGGIFNDGGRLILKGATQVFGNSARLGGGVRLANGSLTLTDTSSVFENTAQSGGGIYMAAGSVGSTCSLVLRDRSSVSRNTSTNIGGGILQASSGSVTLRDQSTVSENIAFKGSGIYNYYGSVTLNDHSSVSDNTASSAGGGIFSSSGSITLKDHGYISRNAATSGGGIYVDQHPTILGLTSTNVFGNTPDNCAPSADCPAP